MTYKEYNSLSGLSFARSFFRSREVDTGSLPWKEILTLLWKSTQRAPDTQIQKCL